MTTTPVSISEYNHRTITIEVSGLYHQTVGRTTPYTVKVPYSSLSRTLQSIQRRGGTVTKVTAAPSASAVVPIAPVATTPPKVDRPNTRVSTPIAPVPVTAGSKKSADTAGKPFKTSNTRSTKQKRR
jgi:phycocyanin-associated, rod